MKTFKNVIKKELLELFNQKILANLIFFGIVFLDALGAIYPEYLNRKITMFAAFPLIFVIHVLNANKINKLFLIALVFNFLGIYNFNNPYEKYNAAGLIYHAIAFLIYVIILFRSFPVVDVKTVVKVLVPLALLVFIPAGIYAEGMHEMVVFKETMLYIFSATIFIFSTVLVYVKHKTKTNRFLVFSAISILISSYFQGYNLFMQADDLFNFFAVIFFNFAHYLMGLYLIRRSENVIVE